MLPTELPLRPRATGTICRKTHCTDWAAQVRRSEYAKDRFRTKSGTTMPSRPEVCRQNAATCEQQAERATDALAKQTFRNAAEQWLNLAALVEDQEKSEWHKADIVSGRRNVR